MGETYTILSFLKFGDEENIYDLYENGTIYMNAIQSFRTIEDGDLRGDRYEGISKITNYPPGEFEIPQLNFKGEYLNIHLQESYENIFGNIYSLYCISSFGWNKPEDVIVDDKIKRFGSHFLMVENLPKFLSLIEHELRKQGLIYHTGFVEYYDKYLINGKITVFQKPKEFEYQKEFRIYVDRLAQTPLILKIGSLKKIAKVFQSEIISEMKLVRENKALLA